MNTKLDTHTRYVRHYENQSAMEQYDWCNEGQNRTPEEYPYAFSEYYVWRDFERGDSSVEAYYTDRMEQWDTEKFRRSVKGRMSEFCSKCSKHDAQQVVKSYFGETYECVGFARSCNVSNGYPLGIFYVRKRK